MWKASALVIFVMSGSGPALAEADPACFSRYTKTNVCDFAKSAQAKIAGTLPMKISQNVTITSVVAAGPELIFSAMWSLTKKDLNDRLALSGKSQDLLIQEMAIHADNYTCSAPVLAAFVRLGGKITNSYKTTDSFLISTHTTAGCPR